MFQNSYQNGSCFQVLDPKAPQDKTKNLFRMQNVAANNKIFDKNLKTFIYEFNTPSSKVCLPREQKKQLYLIQQFLNLQIEFGSTTDWNIELTVSDLTKTKRRIILSPSVHKIEKKPFFVKYPYHEVKEGVWLNFCIDLYSFIEAFKGQTYRSLDLIQITGIFKLRRIFTSQTLIAETGEEHSVSVQQLLPKNLYFPADVFHEDCVARYEELPATETNLDITKSSVKPDSHASNRLIKKQSFSRVEEKKVEKVEQKKFQRTSIGGYKDEKKFLANTQGLTLGRNKQPLNQNSSEASKDEGNGHRTPLSTQKNIKKRQALSKTHIPKPQVGKERTSATNIREKQKQKQKQKLNPWRSSTKTNSTAGRYEPEAQQTRKIQSAETTLFKTNNNLNITKGKSFDHRSDLHSDSDYVQLSQKFSTVTQGRFFKNVLASQTHNEEIPKQSHEQIEENIEIESNSYYQNSDKKPLKQPQNLHTVRPIDQSINDSLDAFTNKKMNVQPTPNKQQMENNSYFNMSSRFGFGERMMNRFMEQVERPYSPPLGEREATQDHESTLGPNQQKEVELIYDPVLNCYYDHKTHTYYELKN